MFCRKCNGRVFVDRVFHTAQRIELFCLMCGKRWILKNKLNGFTIWLNELERRKNRGRHGIIST